jgi:hypothetical protein
MDAPKVLKTNGLLVPDDFPFAHYELIHTTIASKQAGHVLYEHYAGAWNALAYRFRASIDSSDVFVASLRVHSAEPKPGERYMQERALFDFFSSGFSVFESTFYGLYAIGAFLAPTIFPLASERDQQQVTPSRTKDAYARAFPGDPILLTFATLFGDPEYQQWREIRNVLTHRTAPGRRIYVSIGTEDAPPTEWKLNNQPLDESIASVGRRELSRLLGQLLTASSRFVESRF